MSGGGGSELVADGEVTPPRRPLALPRLAARLVLAMLAVAVLSVSAVVTTTWALARQAGASLPATIQLRLTELRDGEAFPARFGVRRFAPEETPTGETAPAGPEPRIVLRTTEPGVDDGEARFLVESDPPPDWPTVQEAVRGIGRIQDAQITGIVVGLGLAAVLSTTLALALARTIARPVEAVGAAASRLARGDLASRAPLPRGALGVPSDLEVLARDFNAMAASLERAEQQRAALLADVAHELRTPLTGMTLRLEALRDGLAELRLEEIDRLIRQTGLLSRLVEDLRVLSLAEAGRLTLHLDDVDLVAIAREVRDAVAPSASAKGVELRLHTEAGGADAVQARGDGDRLAQVLGNLLDNAVRVSPTGGVVTIEVASIRDRAVWRVRDEGPGVAPEQRPHVFERFHQGDGSRRDTRGSSGLGLAIVRSLVELHGGTVSLESPEGGGAVFTVELPTSMSP